MIDFAWSEFLLIALVALIFLGPKELIILFRTLGKWAAKARAWQNAFQEQIKQASLEIEDEQKK